MVSQRALLIFDEKGAAAAAGAKGEGRESLELGKVTSFSGELSSDVLLICGDHEAFLKDAKTVDFIFDNILKVGGKFALKCEGSNAEIGAKLSKHLQCSGFAKVEVAEGGKAVTAEKKAEATEVKTLSFANKIKPAAVKISNEDEEFIDEDALLDEEDLKKPDPSSLRVCGTTGKRKACKDCSCGLAEELSGENEKPQGSAVKSSCGNCYLGDAFRCVACPYAGMPAFKPGEKVQLSNASDL